MSPSEEVLNEPYVMVADLSGIPMQGTLLRKENTLAHFKIDGYLDMNDTVLACPLENEYYTQLPSLDQIRSHEDRISGKIIRIDEDLVYTIRITTQSTKDAQYRIESGNTTIEVKEEGTDYSLVKFQGHPDIQKFVRFHDIVRSLSTRRLNILVELTGLQSIPQTASAIFSDLVEKLILLKRRIAIINSSVLGNHFNHVFKNNKYIRFCPNLAEAQEFFREHRIKVLVVEDEPTTLEMMKTFLVSQKYYPIPVTSGEDALDFLQEETPDLVLMDIHLPGMSGIETVQHIRKKGQFHGLPIIILTGDSDRELVKTSLTLHINGYVLKPFKPDALSRKILAALTD